jgi:hypothetical protein
VPRGGARTPAAAGSPTLWLVAHRGPEGYEWPLPPALGARADLAFVQPTATVAAGSTTAPVAYFSSLASFAGAVAGRALPPACRHVAYDPERWAETPSEEQRDPVASLRAFTALAHRHGLRSVLVPARDLALVPGGACAKRRGETLSRAFVRCAVAAGSTGADYFVIQGARVAAAHETYRWLLGQVSKQVRRESPRTTVLATVNPAADDVRRLAALLRSARGEVRGYEVNCTPSAVGSAVELMSLVP